MIGKLRKKEDSEKVDFERNLLNRGLMPNFFNFILFLLLKFSPRSFFLQLLEALLLTVRVSNQEQT